MPTKRIPQQIINRVSDFILRSQQKRNRGISGAHRALAKMSNADHRTDMRALSKEVNFGFKSNSNTTFPGFRVRQVKVRGNTSSRNVVLKRSHDPNSVRFVRDFVAKHNKIFSPKKYIIFQPKGYEVGADMVLMRKTNKPSVAEIYTEKGFPTKRGQEFFAKLVKKHNVTNADLKSAFEEFEKNFSTQKRQFGTAIRLLDKGNILLVGYRKGKFVFVPLIDLA
jgi:hypothetical protein